MSKRKNQGVKRAPGKCHGENYAQQLERATYGEYQAAYYNGEIYEQDLMLIALKRIGILGPKRIEQLEKALREARRDYLELVIDECKDDKMLWHTKGKLDEELKSAVGEEHFVGWDLRHDLNFHTEGLRSYEVKAALDNAIAEQLAMQQAKLALQKKYSK